MKYTENDLREAFRAGRLKGEFPSYMQGELNEDEWIEYYTKPKPIEEEKTIDIPYSWIKVKCGWSKFCDVTGGNHYAINEGYNPSDRELFTVKISHAKKLGYI